MNCEILLVCRLKWPPGRKWYNSITMIDAKWLAGLILLTVALGVRAEERSVLKDIEYARVDDAALLLDLYKPSPQQTGPLIVYIHGGA